MHCIIVTLQFLSHTEAMASGTKSAVWRFFLKESKDWALCFTCNKRYSRKGRGTSNLKNHLKSKHKDQYEELLKEEEANAEKKDSNESLPLQKIMFDIEQRKVDEYFQNVAIWDNFHAKSQEMDKYVAEMLVLDDLPFSHVENVGFKRLMSKSVPQYKLKPRDFYSTMICTDIYDGVRVKIKKIICDIIESQSNSVSFTADLWSDISPGVSLLSLTAHAVNCDFKRINFVLGAQKLEDSHTGECLSKTISNMLCKWGISPTNVHCVVHNAGADMRKALSLSGLNKVECVVHKLHLVVQQGLQSQKQMIDIIEKFRRLATHFHHSTIAQDELKNIQDQFHEPHLKVLLDTQANSTLYMLKRTKEIKEPLTAYIAKHSKLPQITNLEWQTLSQIIEALQPFEEIITKMSESTSTIADVIPHILCLKTAIQNQVPEDDSPHQNLDDSPHQNLDSESTELADLDENQTKIVNCMKDAMRADINKRFAEIEMDYKYTVATYLNPRYKGKFFSSADITEKVQKKIACLCGELLPVCQSEDGKASKKRKIDNGSNTSANLSIDNAMAMILASSSDEESQSKETRITDMVKKYHKEKRVLDNSDPLKWWKDNNSKFPELGQLAQKYLSCPPSSVMQYNEKNGSLQGDKAEKLLFLKKNLPLLEFNY